MRTFKSDVSGNEDDEGGHFTVILDSEEEMRKFRNHGELPTDRRTSIADTPKMTIIFEAGSGVVKRLPGYGNSQMNAEEAAYFQSLRHLAVTSDL